MVGFFCLSGTAQWTPRKKETDRLRTFLLPIARSTFLSASSAIPAALSWPSVTPANAVSLPYPAGRSLRAHAKASFIVSPAPVKTASRSLSGEADEDLLKVAHDEDAFDGGIGKTLPTSVTRQLNGAPNADPELSRRSSCRTWESWDRSSQRVTESASAS